MKAIQKEIQGKQDAFDYNLSMHEVSYQLTQLQTHVKQLAVTKREAAMSEGTLVWHLYEQLKRDQEQGGKKKLSDSILRLK